MADLDRSGVSDIVLRDSKLKQQWIAIQISEKKIQLKQLDVALDRLQSVDMKKVIHAIDKCKKELQEAEEYYKTIIVDIKETKKGGK